MIAIDHVGIPARDARASAHRLAEILGARAPTPDGADDDMFRVDLTGGSFVLFNPASRIDVAHVAFRVAEPSFAGIVERLRGLGMTFGNDPEEPWNGLTDDPLGGNGRVYFLDPDGHLFEVTC